MKESSRIRKLAALRKMKAESSELPRVKSHQKRWCPECQSNRWTWRGAVPVTLEELAKYLLVKYQCQKCQAQFLVEEAKGARVVSSVERCVGCGSTRMEKTSSSGADIEIYRCKQCNCYMAIGPPGE